MSSFDEARGLAAALAGMLPPQVRAACRAIEPGDERLLHDDELPAFRHSVAKVRRQSGAARGLARGLLREFGFGDAALLRTDGGAVRWPPGVVGSLAHDDAFAVAAIAPSSAVAMLGVDIEPSLPLPAGVPEIVSTRRERTLYGASLRDSRLLFSLKEAVFKAQYPVDGLLLDFGDVEIDLAARTGTTRGGRRLGLAFVTAPRLITLAFRPRGEGWELP